MGTTKQIFSRRTTEIDMKIQIKIKTNGEAYYYAVQFNKYMINYLVSSKSLILNYFHHKIFLPEHMNRRALIKITTGINNNLQDLINILNGSKIS